MMAAAMLRGLLVGTLMPQPRIRCGSDRQRLDELTGRGWRVVFAPGEDAKLPASFERRLIAVPIDSPRLVECVGIVGQWFDASNCRSAIVRPHHYVWA